MERAGRGGGESIFQLRDCSWNFLDRSLAEYNICEVEYILKAKSVINLFFAQRRETLITKSLFATFQELKHSSKEMLTLILNHKYEKSCI